MMVTNRLATMRTLPNAFSRRVYWQLGLVRGIPPLGGFIGKLYLFIAAFQAGLYGLLAVAIIGVVISIYYYFGWIREAFFSHYNDQSEARSWPILFSRDRLLLALICCRQRSTWTYPAALSLLP